MKASGIVSYLLRHMLHRWQEQPGSPLARVIVTVIILSVSLLILLTLYIMRVRLDNELTNFGLNRIVIEKMIQPETYDSTLALLHNSSINNEADIYQLWNTHKSAKTDLKHTVPILAYSTAPSDKISPLLNVRSITYWTHELAEDLQIAVTIENTKYTSITQQPPDWLSTLGLSKVILAPKNLVYTNNLHTENQILLIELKEESSITVQSLANALRSAARLNEEQQLSIRDPAVLAHKVAQLKRDETRWRLGISIAMGTIIAVVFGAFAVFEYRESRYVNALLKSFGVKPLYIYLSAFTEALIIGSIACLTCASIGYFWGHELLGALGYDKSLTTHDALAPFLKTNTAILAYSLLAGTIVSTLPVARGLKQEIGVVLS